MNIYMNQEIPGFYNYGLKLFGLKAVRESKKTKARIQPPSPRLRPSLNLRPDKTFGPGKTISASADC